ncbi:MAG: L,D-transpeptidase [Bacteroidota bacterium]|nr:L,D-transpeptidase [Bacteroidota bacterium]
MMLGRRYRNWFLLSIALGVSCSEKKELVVYENPVEELQKADSLLVDSVVSIVQDRAFVATDIQIEKALVYQDYTLEDEYPYKDTVRVFQWDKIKERLAYVENFQTQNWHYAVLQNYKNRNSEAPTVRNYVRNIYNRVSDTLGVERYQSIPLYFEHDYLDPIIYARDGSLVRTEKDDTLSMVKVTGISFDGVWDVPKKYIKFIGDTIRFEKIVVVDVTNQNIATLEKVDSKWLVRSMNPATTGVQRPPYAQKTPTGMFVIQESKPKMYYYKDGTTTIEGYAPFASRFTNGAYIHGVPVNNPKGKMREYSPTLGTVPRSHMCVRNVSSHAEYIYNWAKPLQSLVIVID